MIGRATGPSPSLSIRAAYQRIDSRNAFGIADRMPLTVWPSSAGEASTHPRLVCFTEPPSAASAADLEQVQAEPFHFGQHAIQSAPLLGFRMERPPCPA